MQINSLLFYVVNWFLANRPGFIDISGTGMPFVKREVPLNVQVSRVHSDFDGQNSGGFLILNIPVDTGFPEWTELFWVFYLRGCLCVAKLRQGFRIAGTTNEASKVRKTNKGVVLIVRLNVIESSIHRNKRLLANDHKAFAISNDLNVGGG